MLADCFSILLQRPKRQHHHHTDHIGKRARIEQGRPRTTRRLVARQVFLVDELIGKNQYREYQRQRPSCPRPRILTTEEEIRRKISTEEEDQRREDELDYVGGKDTPARAGFHWT